MVNDEIIIRRAAVHIVAMLPDDMQQAYRTLDAARELLDYLNRGEPSPDADNVISLHR
jgi:hypothetical protein